MVSGLLNNNIMYTIFYTKVYTVQYAVKYTTLNNLNVEYTTEQCTSHFLLTLLHNEQFTVLYNVLYNVQSY